jgi:hypothetical protein
MCPEIYALAYGFTEYLQVFFSFVALGYHLGCCGYRFSSATAKWAMLFLNTKFTYNRC